MGEHSKGVFGDEQREDIIQSISWSIPPGRIKLNDGTEIYKREFIEKFILSEEHIFSNTVDIEELVQSALEGNVNKYVIDDAYIDHMFDEMAENMIIKNENTDYQFFLEGLDGIDLRDKFDLDGLSPEMFRYLLFDSRTVFSDIQMERFKPHELIEKGKNNEKTNLELNGEGTCAKNIFPQTENFDETHPLYNKTCVFTGVLEKVDRKQAMQIVANLGGICGDSVTSKTNYLILGNNDYCRSIKDGKSSKQKKAEILKLKGNDIEIIPENVFYEMIEEN